MKNQKLAVRLFKKKMTLSRLLSLLAPLLIAALFTAYNDLSYPVRIPEDGEPLAIYSNDAHHDIKKLYLQAVKDANSSIHLYTYTLTDPEFIEHLIEKSHSGIPVTIICDKESAKKTKLLFGRSIKIIPRDNDALMHLKILLIDEKKVLLGSANMTKDSLTMHHNNVCTIHSENLAQHLLALTEELQRPNNLTGSSIPEKTFRIGGQHIEMWMLAGNPRASKRLIQLIDSAKKSIKVAMFTFTRYDMTHALLRASKRGVKVEVAIDKKCVLGDGKHVANLLFYQNVPLKTNRGAPLLHHKCMIVDDEIFVTGSANWTKRAFNDNDDFFMVIHHLLPDQKNTLFKLWENLYQGCERVVCNEEKMAA